MWVCVCGSHVLVVASALTVEISIKKLLFFKLISKVILVSFVQSDVIV